MRGAGKLGPDQMPPGLPGVSSRPAPCFFAGGTTFRQAGVGPAETQTGEQAAA